MAKPDKKHNIRINSQVSSKSIILIDENGVKLGAVSNQIAVSKAQAASLDLIEISYNGQTDESVCKLGDFGKYLYDKKKKEKEQEKQQRKSAIEVKEIQLRPTTDKHDIEIKAKKTLNFLEEGDKVRVIMQMFHREATHKDVGEATLKQFLELIDPEYIEKPMYYEGNNIVVVLFKKRK